MPQNRVSDTITHVILNTVNGAVHFPTLYRHDLLEKMPQSIYESCTIDTTYIFLTSYTRGCHARPVLKQKMLRLSNHGPQYIVIWHNKTKPKQIHSFFSLSIPETVNMLSMLDAKHCTTCPFCLEYLHVQNMPWWVPFISWTGGQFNSSYTIYDWFIDYTQQETWEVHHWVARGHQSKMGPEHYLSYSTMHDPSYGSLIRDSIHESISGGWEDAKTPFQLTHSLLLWVRESWFDTTGSRPLTYIDGS